MIIQLDSSILETDRSRILAQLNASNYQATLVRTQRSEYVVAIGKKEIDIRQIGSMPGVLDIHIVSDAYKLVSRKWKVRPSQIDLGNSIRIYEGGCAIIAGPCSIENEDQIRKVANYLKEQGLKIMRGGAFKPRTSPYTFRGHGIEGLVMFKQIANEYGLKVISEVVDASDISAMYEHVDIFQVGTRNSQNFSLLHELGKIDKPVLIKRAMSGTIEELLQSAEYVFSQGNEALLLCERGIRTFEKSYRNTLDLNSIPVLKEKSHLPVIVDPSHGIGIRRFVTSMALAAIMAGADGLLIEIHETPEKALSDADQTLNFEESSDLIKRCNATLKLRESF